MAEQHFLIAKYPGFSRACTIDVITYDNVPELLADMPEGEVTNCPDCQRIVDHATNVLGSEEEVANAGPAIMETLAKEVRS